MNIFKSRSSDSEVIRLRNIISEETQMLKKSEAVIQTIEETERNIHETKQIIRDKRRSYTRGFPLSAYYDICRVLHLDPDERFPPELKKAEQKNKSAEVSTLSNRPKALQIVAQIRKQIHRHQEMLRCAGASLGTIDYEVYPVLKKYSDLDIDVTIDEAIGIALANIYQLTGDTNEVRRIAMRGQFALRETGNCVVDAVYDPELRKRMAKKYKQVGKWGRLMLMREYLRIAEESGDYSTIKAYKVKPDQLKNLPEYVLYGLVVIEEGHVLRILKVEKDGFHGVEGNFSGDMNFGRFVPFGEVTQGNDSLIVYSRQPCNRYGVDQEFVPYDFTNPDAVVFDNIAESVEDLNSSVLYKVTPESLYTKLPQRVRPAITVLRLICGKSYDMMPYAEVVDNAESLFPGYELSDIVSVFLQGACCNPTGMIVAFPYGDRDKQYPLPQFTRELAPDIAKQICVFFKKEGGEQKDLLLLKKTWDNVVRGRDMALRILLLTTEEFMSLSENERRAMILLTPERDEDGNHKDGVSYWEPHLVKVCSINSAMLLDDDYKREVSFNELLQNPFKTLILLETMFDMLGVGTRLSADEMSIADKYPLRWVAEDMGKHISLKFEIRNRQQ